MAYGLWLVAYGLWLVAYGLWLMAYGKNIKMKKDVFEASFFYWQYCMVAVLKFF
jgi:hypothetical protein